MEALHVAQAPGIARATRADRLSVCVRELLMLASTTVILLIPGQVDKDDIIDADHREGRIYPGDMVPRSGSPELRELSQASWTRTDVRRQRARAF